MVCYLLDAFIDSICEKLKKFTLATLRIFAGNLTSILLLWRGVPLYLEWAPSNVLSQNSTSENDGKNTAVGEHDAKRVILEQHLEGMSDVDLDPDRVEVCHLISI